MLRATEKHKWFRVVKSKLRVLRHFKVNPVLKIDETVYKQAESMCFLFNKYDIAKNIFV